MSQYFDSFFKFDTVTDKMGIIAQEGSLEFARKVDRYLVKWYNLAAAAKGYEQKSTFIIESQCPRFTTGDGKAIITESVRGMDLYYICDTNNYSITYNMYGQNVPMSPDDHWCDLKRLIMASNGKANRITVIMPILYGGRQHRRNGRESLDCATMLQELNAMGVKDVITFDAHDPRVQNAAPMMGFDNFFPTYQILKALFAHYPEVIIDKNNFMVVSPDEGAMGRNIYYASTLGVDLGMFYKRRDYSTVINGRNPIVAHEYIGSSVMGMDVFVADDIIATGDSILKLARELKEKGANKIFLCATFALFTEGISKFRKAYDEGLFTAVISTNLTYTKPELDDCEWFIKADLSKFIAYIISAVAQNKSVGVLTNPLDKINELLDAHKKK